MASVKSDTDAPKTADNLGGEFGKFLNNNNPALTKRIKEMLPELVGVVADFIEEKFPGQAEDFLSGFVAGIKGISKDQLKYNDSSELKAMAVGTLEGFLGDTTPDQE